MKEKSASNNKLSRRTFIKKSAYISGATILSTHGSRLFAADSDQLGIAIVGCGDRGTFDLIQCLQSSEGVALVAIADMFQDKVDQCMQQLQKEITDKKKLKVTPDTVYLGFDAYKKVLAMKEVDLVLLTTPPGFRPQMLRAAIEAGKHVFIEKPGAVDPVGIRSLLETTELAKQKRAQHLCGFSAALDASVYRSSKSCAKWAYRPGYECPGLLGWRYGKVALAGKKTGVVRYGMADSLLALFYLVIG